MPLSATDLLAKMTAAIMADETLQDAVRTYDEDTLDSFIKWLREDGIEVVVHGKFGPPSRKYMFMGSHGTHLYWNDWYSWPSVKMFPKKLIPHRRYAVGDFDLRYVDDIRRGRLTTNTLRTAKYVEGDLKLNDLRGPLLISLVCPNSTLDIDIPDQQNRMRFMDGLTALVLPTLTQFGLPVGIRAKENSMNTQRSLSVFGRRRSITLPTERFSKPPNDMRAVVFAIMYNKWMDRFILTCIIISTVSMAFNGQSARSDVKISATLFVLEWIVAIIFILEAAARIIALEGFVYYWNDPWNRLDFSIVVLGLVTELPFVSGVNFSAFRAFRALRALRTMKYAQGLRQIVDTFIETFRGVINVLFVYLYFVFLFATLGIDLFQGTLQSKCVVPTQKDLFLSDAPFGVGNFTVATPSIYCIVPNSADPSSSSEVRGATTAGCPKQQICQHVGNPGTKQGFLSFDSFGPSMLTVVRYACVYLFVYFCIVLSCIVLSFVEFISFFHHLY